MRRLILLLSVGWLPPYLHPSGACLCLGTRMPYGSQRHRGLHQTGAAPLPMHVTMVLTQGLGFARCHLLRFNVDLFGDRPDEPDQLPRHPYHHLVGMLASGDELSVAFAQAHLGFPTEVLQPLGFLLQSQLQMAAHFGRVAIGPGPFDPHATGMGMARLGDSALTTPFPTGGL